MKIIVIPFLLALIICNFIFVSCNNAAKEKSVGIQLWSVRDSMNSNPVKTIQELGKMGYKFVETAGYHNGKLYGMTPDSFKSIVETNGMKVLGGHTGQVAPDSARWDSTMMWWDKAIATHKAAGVEYIVQPFMGQEGYESIAGLANYCKYFNAVGEKCNAQGIRFGYHNHDGEFKSIDSVVIYDYMLQNTDPKLVMFQLDLYWIYMGGKDPIDYFKNYPGRFELFHVKDEEELGASGKIDFKPAFDNAKQAGLKYYVVEVERYNFEPLVSISKSYDFIKNAAFINF